MTSRYAIYFAPDFNSDLWRFGTSWLGRDPVTGAALAQPALEGLNADFLAMATESPRHYGFHATLKPPFALADGVYAAHLVHALSEFAVRREPFSVPNLKLARLDRFLALVLSAADANVTALAEGCLRDFDRFRAPPTEKELAERRKPGLTPRQEELLVKWGYPYVFDDFRFHMSLTGPLSPDELDRVEKALTPTVAPYCATPLSVSSICLYWQKDRDVPFTLVRRFPFG